MNCSFATVLSYRKWLLLTLLPLLLSGCIDFSPYAVETSDRNLTASNISRLEATSQNAFVPFKFAVISDSHTGYEELEDAVSVLNRRSDISFVLHAGDLTDSGLLQEYQWSEAILSRLHVPYLTVIGNHDALNNGKKNYAALYGPFDYGFVFNQVKFTALNSNSWEFDNTVPRLDWLGMQLADYPVYQHQIVLAHILPQDERFSVALADEYKQVLKDHFVSLIVGGHGHNYQYTEDMLTSGTPIGFLITGAILKRTFVIVSVEAGDVTHIRVSY